MVEGDKGLCRPNFPTTLAIFLMSCPPLFRNFVNTTDYHLGRHEGSFPYTKELHGPPQRVIFDSFCSLTRRAF